MSNPRQKTIVKEKMTQKYSVKTKQKTGLKQRLALHALQKQLQNTELKEWLMIISFTAGAAALRVPMQALPSAEPLSFFAILAGWLFGMRKGFLVGATSLYLSNFLVMGGHGPWTLFQAIGFGLIGFLGGLLRGTRVAKNPVSYAFTTLKVLLVVITGTLAFEILMNLQSSVFFGFNVFVAFIGAIPFTITHIVSNIGFALFLPLAFLGFNKLGGFDEKELARKLISKLRNTVTGNNRNNISGQ